MTATIDTEQLVAGRELDALIAEKIMWWKVIETDDCNGIDNFWLSEDGKNVLKGFVHDRELPQYSNSIADAWQVVEKMSEGFFFMITDNDEGYGICCRFTKHRGSTIDNETWEEKTPLAICRAALKAIGN